MRFFAELVTRRPLLTLLAVAALTVFALARIVDPRSGDLQLEIDPSVESLLPAGDESRADYEYVRRLFGSDDTILVALTADDVFADAPLARVEALTERLERLPGVHHVVSLANALDLRGHDGEIEVAPFMDGLPQGAAGREALRRAVLGNPLYAGSLASRDGRATLLFVHLEDRPERELLASGLVADIQRVVEEERGEAEVLVTGGLYAKAETSRLMLEDMSRTLPLAALAVTFVALLSFRSLRGVLLPAATVVLAVIWTLGAISALGIALNLVTVILPTLLLVVGFAYGVHMVSEYYDVLGRETGEDAGGDVAPTALREVALPIVLTGVTTAAGFVSLALSPIHAIREFGLLATLGVAFCVLSTLTFAPALLAVLPERRWAHPASGEGLVDRAAEWLGGFDLRYRGLILLGGGGIAVVAALSIPLIHVSTEFVERGGALYRAAELLNRHLDGASGLTVVVEGDEPGAFQEPENLRVLEQLQAWLVEQPEVGGATGLTDYVKLLNRGFHDGDPEQLVIPPSRRFASQLLFFGSSDDLERFVDSRYRTTALHVRSRAKGSADMSKLVSRIEARLAGLPEPLSGRVTGNLVLVTRTLDDLARGQALSLGLAFTLILAVLALLFLSLRAGLLALVPNAIPVLLYFGILGLGGITLNTTTGLVACMVLGIAVDDTIHYLARFSVSARRLADERPAVIDALRAVGRPVTYTSAALCLGFLALTTSRFENQVQFGVLAAVTLAFAWLLDVTFTPAIASRMRIVSLWDVLTLDLGEAPHLSIPLLRGMSLYGARITALMTRIVTYPKGHELIRAGDSGDEMYVVIDGEVRAFLPTEQGGIDFATMGRGAAFGEVALFRGHRTASVVAESDVRLLAFTRSDLDRLARRHPRIATKLFANLSEVLAERVASTTARVGRPAGSPGDP
jgi:predicted RND superfamily exporter protein